MSSLSLLQSILAFNPHLTSNMDLSKSSPKSNKLSPPPPNHTPNTDLPFMGNNGGGGILMSELVNVQHHHQHQTSQTNANTTTVASCSQPKMVQLISGQPPMLPHPNIRFGLFEPPLPPLPDHSRNIDMNHSNHQYSMSTGHLTFPHQTPPMPPPPPNHNGQFVASNGKAIRPNHPHHTETDEIYGCRRRQASASSALKIS